MDKLAQLQQRIGHVFKDSALLQTALTHPSYAQEVPNTPNNQRLEFLGDAVLDLALAEILCRIYPKEREGFLSDARAALANAHTLAEISRQAGIPDYMRMASHEAASGARTRDNLAADALEALIGAVFKEAGYLCARECISRLFGDLPARLQKLGTPHNAKGRLQEWVAAHPEYPKIEYALVAQTGPDHAKRFAVEVRAGGRILGVGESSSRRGAESKAAAMAMQALEKEGGSSRS